VAFLRHGAWAGVAGRNQTAEGKCGFWPPTAPSPSESGGGPAPRIPHRPADPGGGCSSMTRRWRCSGCSPSRRTAGSRGRSGARPLPSAPPRPSPPRRRRGPPGCPGRRRRPLRANGPGQEAGDSMVGLWRRDSPRCHPFLGTRQEGHACKSGHNKRLLRLCFESCCVRREFIGALNVNGRFETDWRYRGKTITHSQGIFSNFFPRWRGIFCHVVPPAMPMGQARGLGWVWTREDSKE